MLPEEEKDVNQVDPSPAKEDVFEDVEKDVNKAKDPSPEQTPQEAPQEEVSSPQDVKPEVVDSRPIENVAWETKRKIDELYPIVNDLKTMMLEKQSAQPQQPTYSKAQLQAYAVAPDTTTEQRLWSYGEIDKMEKSERVKEFQEIIRSTKEKSDSENKRGQATQWVAQAFPDMIIKDSNGNPIGWKQDHPILQRANHYMQTSKSLQDNPEGFAAAVKMAAFDLGVTSNKQLSQKVGRTIGQLRKEQKKGLASTGGITPKEEPGTKVKTRLLKLQQEYAKTGNKEIFVEIVKLRGMNPFT